MRMVHWSLAPLPAMIKGSTRRVRLRGVEGSQFYTDENGEVNYYWNGHEAVKAQQKMDRLVAVSEREDHRRIGVGPDDPGECRICGPVCDLKLC